MHGLGLDDGISAHAAALLSQCALVLALLALLFVLRQRRQDEDLRRTSADVQASLVDRLAHLSTHDALTGLPNRRVLEDRMAESVAATARESTLVAVLFIDLDRFKDINDRFGHVAGDRLLIAAASQLSTVLRPEDTLARVGGDEFVALCARLTDVDEAMTLARSVEAHVVRYVDVDGTVVEATLSVGVVVADHHGIHIDGASDGHTWSGDAAEPRSLLTAADSAMYWAKNLGRARHYVYDAHVAREHHDRARLVSDLRAALAGDEVRGGRLWVAYQLLVDLPSGEPVGVEALARWTHPSLGAVPPDTFIPVAENSGSIGALGALVTRAACSQTAHWNVARERHALPPLKVSVNCSGRQLLQPGYAADLAETLLDTGLPARQLVVELTESVLVDSMADAAARLRQLHSMGLQLALDDFGTGYSSLSYLRRFPFGLIKIDRSFAGGLGLTQDDETIVRTVVGLGYSLQRSVVIEGIEREDQAERARQLGCQLAQGDLFGRPAAAEDLTTLLTTPPLHIKLPEHVTVGS